MKVEFMKKYEIFQTIPYIRLQNLTYFLKVHEYQKGQVVYKEGIDHMDKIYIVKSGEFEVFKKREEIINGEGEKGQYVHGSIVDYEKFRQT